MFFSQLNITQSFWNAVQSLHGPDCHFTVPAGNLTDSSRQTQFSVTSFSVSDDTVPSFCSPSQEPAALGDSSRWNLRFTGVVCLFTSRARREAMLVPVCPRPSPPPSPVWGSSVCVSISDTSPGLIPSLGDRANLSGETAD